MNGPGLCFRPLRHALVLKDAYVQMSTLSPSVFVGPACSLG